MPTLEYPDLRYLGLVAAAIEARRLPPVSRQDCPCCGHDHPDQETHVIVNGDVIITCTGYRVIDPNAVGIVDPGWQPR